jgi:hypothetical protein
MKRFEKSIEGIDNVTHTCFDVKIAFYALLGLVL